MNPEVKEKWVAALRSGEYKQTEGTLNRNDEGFCCLGVLCELAAKEGVVEKVGQRDPEETQPRQTDLIGYRDKSDHSHQTYSQYDVLPRPVMEWAGLTSRNPQVLYDRYGDNGKDTFVISDLNDDFHLKFPEIANVIEEQL